MMPMSEGIWEPGGARKSSLDQAMLRKVVSAAANAGRAGGSCAAALKESGLETDQWLMRCEPGDWDIAAALATDEIVALIRFFTLLEKQVSGWSAGDKSPVIPLVKILKRQDKFSPALRKWIKSNTDNRYLPYGSAL